MPPALRSALLPRLKNRRPRLHGQKCLISSQKLQLASNYNLNSLEADSQKTEVVVPLFLNYLK
jgi:hypothetical protein